MKKTIVVYSGRFQPFHPGHFGMYQHLVKKFGKENVFIGTSNKVESEKSPFNFKEKHEIITTLFKVPKDKVIQVKNPYKPTEILSKYQPSDTSYLTVVSEKDADRFKGKYFRKWEGNAEVGYEDGGYLYVGPMFAKSVSASDVRKNLSNGTDEDKQEFFKKVYPKLDNKIYKLITTKLNEVITIKKEIIEQWLITHGSSALNEGTNTFGGGAVDDGPLGFFRDFNVFDKIATKRAKHIGYTVLDMIDKDHITDTTDHPDYPNGPTKAVSYYPAGVIGKISANNQIDVYSSDAYSKWYKHMTRKAGLVGYQVVQSQLMSDERKEIKDLSGSDAKSVKDLASEFATMMHESIELPVEIGDTILTGKWRNKKTIVKSIGKNEYGMPTINGKNVVNFKMVKEGNLVDLEPQMNSLTEAQNKLGLKVPSNIQKLHKLFKKNGYKLYIVGGAVRDAILGKNPHDFDLTTDAKPDEVLKIAKSAGLHTSEVGKQFGIVIVDGDEIATFRKDSIGTKRMNTTVDYTDIQGDVARRDLTINALFYDLDTKEIVDLVGGIADLKSKTIRTVGVAEDRFNEDPLRKLRALRFNARVNGKLHHETLLALKKDPSLTGVSPERIRDEFIKSIESAKSVKNYLDLNDKLGFSKLILPGLKVSKPNIDENDHELLLSMLLRDNDSRMLSKTLNKLKYSSKEIKNITFLQSLIDFKDENIADYKRAQSKTSLLPEQIKKFGKYISKDFSKLLKFKLSVSGNDAPKGTKGKDIKTWIDHQEFSRFQNENIQLVETIEKFIKVVNHGILKEDMTKDDLVSVEKSADAKLKPIDVKFTRHFLDRVNDPRNGKEITKPELINFFKRLSRTKKHFSVFLDKYREIMVKDNQTKINIPFVQQANKLIAKTIMRTANWRQRKTPEFKFESVSKSVQTMLNRTQRGIKYIKLDQNGKKLSNWATLKTSASIHKEVDYMNSKYERSEFTHDGASIISYVDVKTGKLYAQWVRGKDNIFTYNHSPKPIKGLSESNSRSIQTLLDRRQPDIKYLKLDQDGKEVDKWTSLVSSYNIDKEMDYMNSHYKRSPDTHGGKDVISYVEIPNGKIYRQYLRGKDNIFSLVRNPKPIKGLSESIEDCKVVNPPTVSDVIKKHSSDRDAILDQLRKGIRVEFEHTDDTKIAAKIAMDHLMEDPIYYDKLEKMENEVTNESTTNPTITILVGPPASGKSTWVNKNKKNSIIISRDDIVEKHAKNHGITYNETFGNKEIQKAVNTELESHTVKTIKSGKDIIVDMTNMSKKSRSRMLNRVPDNYTKNAVVFNVPKSELIKRLDNREKETGKHIPLNVIDDMIKRFEQPTKDEFDNVTNENFMNESNESELKKLERQKMQLTLKGMKMVSGSAPQLKIKKELAIVFGKIKKLEQNENVIMENKQVKTFKELLRMMPTKIQKLVMDLKNTPQSAEHHPEGNVLKHTITVVNRALKHAPGDMDLAVAAMFHDLGKATTAGTNKKGNITHYGHEKASRKYVKQFSSEIEKLGANPKNVLYIVGNHMRMHQFDNMRQTKKDMMIAHDQFKQLQKFASKIDGGGLKLDKEPKNESITDLVNDLMENLEDFVLPEIKLHEGGAATGGSPIPAEHGMPMYNDVVSKLMSLVKIDKSDARPLGSTGKKAKGQLSGDIDIALNGTKIASEFGLKFDEVSDFLYNKVKGTFKNAVQMKGLGITSFLFPIPESDEFGQVDLMLTDNMDLSTFMFHSPNFIKNESKYKGLYRNALLFSITKYMDVNMKPEHFENGDVKKFQKYTLSQKKGLITQIKSYEGKLGKQLKNCKPIKGCDVVVTNAPSDIVKYIFGDEYTIDDMKSFESIYKIVKSSKFKHKKHFSKIMSTFKDTIIKGKKMPLPSELD